LIADPLWVIAWWNNPADNVSLLRQNILHYQNGAEYFWRSYCLLKQSRNYPNVIRAAGLFPFSQEQALCPPPTSDQSSECYPILLF
jgi:hypothetical protein